MTDPTVEAVARAMSAADLPEISADDFAYKYALGDTRTEKVWETFKPAATAAIEALKALGWKPPQ
jgi:ABC-type phosphate transport system permease subunit